MSLTLDDVRHIARLARIELAAGEDEATRAKLAGIFGLIEAMQAVDTRGVEPMSHPQDLSGQLSQRLRPDVATEADRREAFQAIAPQTEAGLYLVPKVIE
jgi:aspartyl-tRNA(Asn)/glutamyl-tRNA(Gln) amidotransferase subunit C